MRCLLLTLALLAGTLTICFGQSAYLNAGLELGFPVGKAGNSYTKGFGGSVKCEYLAGEDFFLSLSVGYSRFGLTDAFKQQLQHAGYSDSSYGFLPIKIGGKLYLSKSFFTELQFGNTFNSSTVSLSNPNSSALTFSPGIGYSLKNGIELGTRYEGWLTNGLFSQYGLRLAYRFKL